MTDRTVLVAGGGVAGLSQARALRSREVPALVLERRSAAADAGTALLQARGLSKRYGGVVALAHLDLSVHAGEIVALIGPNGAGKTTLLRVVSGLLPRTRGTVLLDGRDLTDPAHQLAGRGVAHVPEGRLVFPSLTVQDNLALGAYTRHRRRSPQQRQEIDDVLTLFPRLVPRRRQPAGTLSGGEQQMLAIGRALLSRPTVLVLDEPSVGLAPQLVEEIFAALGRLRDGGTAVLLVEQNVRAAFAVADHAYLLERGRATGHGTPDELGRSGQVEDTYLGGVVG